MADDTYTVERSTTIEAPAALIYEQIADFHNWPTWSPWEDIDPDLQRAYSGPQAGVGATYSWSGNRKAGRGRMEITAAEEPVAVAIDLVFEKPFKARNDTGFSLRPEGSGTVVTWTMNGRKTVLTRVMGVFLSMEKLLGPDFEKGLARLKTATEQRIA
jgi:polyketide cyclase/dehydrase/lipid transport protein